MLLKFEIGGNMDVNCDRCSNNLSLDLWDEFNITVKMVENPEVMNNQEDDPDMYYIAQGESYFDWEGDEFPTWHIIVTPAINADVQTIIDECTGKVK